MSLSVWIYVLSVYEFVIKSVGTLKFITPPYIILYNLRKSKDIQQNLITVIDHYENYNLNII